MTYQPNISDFGLLAGNFDPQYRTVHRFGYNEAVGANSTEDIWLNGGELAWQSSAQTIRLVSSDANDTAAGTGARKVTIEGLDINFHEISEEVTLSGTTPVNTTQTFFRLNRMRVSEVGTYHGTNLGTVTATWAAGVVVAGTIGIGRGQTQRTHYTVPEGYTAYLTELHAGVESGKTANVTLWRYENASDVTLPYTSARRTLINILGLTGDIDFAYNGRVRFPERTDIWCTATAGSQQAGVSAEYCLFLVQNPT